jgi:hypothetical protein
VAQKIVDSVESDLLICWLEKIELDTTENDSENLEENYSMIQSTPYSSLRVRGRLALTCEICAPVSSGRAQAGRSDPD